MNRNGFTLIELLGVIALLGIIIVIAVPAFVESNRVAQANEEEDFNETIEVATKDYINSCSSFDTCLAKHEDGFENLFASSSSATVSASELIEAGFLKDDLENPTTGKTIKDENKNIKVTSNNGKLTVNYGG